MVDIRCGAYKCDNMVSVTDEEMSDSSWRRYRVHCPEHQSPESRDAGPQMKSVTITFKMHEEEDKALRLIMKVNGVQWHGAMDVCHLLCEAKHEIFIELTEEVASKFTLAPHAQDVRKG